MTGTLPILFLVVPFLAVIGVVVERRLVGRQVQVRLQNARARALGLHVAEQAAAKGPLSSLVASLGSMVTASRLISTKTRIELEQTLRAGGLAGAYNLELFVGSKIILVLGLPFGTFMALRDVAMKPLLFVVAIAAAGVFGLMLPNMIVGQRRKNYLAAIDRGLADGLDMMVICAEAGLTLEATLQRVGTEIVHAHPRLASELIVTSNELALASDVRQALISMGSRTGLVGLVRLGTTLVQSLQYGTPLSAALRTLATELRQETLTKFEERAARLPVLLTIPMILFILPCVFLIVAGPIAIQVMKAMHQ